MILRPVARRLVVAGTGGASILALSSSNAVIYDDVRFDEKSLSERLYKAKIKTIEVLGLDAVDRASRALYYASITAMDYKTSLGLSGKEIESEEYKALQSQVHLRSAKRLLHVCQVHGGIYSKFGQYLASLVRIIPDEFTDTLRALQDANPGCSFKDVSRVIQEEFGQPLSSLYKSFDSKPLAAASLAQVHHAQTFDGQTVAVKIQYPNLVQATKMDVGTLKLLAYTVGILFPDYEYAWLFPEFEESINLELDFLQEATNAERIAKLMAKNAKIYIPKIRWDLSTHRVLTMEFIDGIKVNNVKALKAKGINPLAVGETISSLFSHMIFAIGYIHTDAHAGNILIRRPPVDPNASWWGQLSTRVQQLVGLRPSFEVVLLDHGMYRRLNETFRLSYCNLWKAFMTRDEQLGREATRQLGLDPDYFELLSLISVNRTPKSRSSLGEQLTVEERTTIREKYKDRTRYGAEQLRQLIEGLPRDVLFVFRSNSLVRSLNTELGAGTGTRFRIFGSSAVVGLSMPTIDPLPPAYFLEEIRDYSQVLPASAGGGRVIQKRRKVEMLRRPEAAVNRSTAAEAFLFSREKRPILKEIKRQLAVTDLRIRLWVMDAGIEWFMRMRGLMVFLRERRLRSNDMLSEEKGEVIVEEELRLKTQAAE